MPLVPAICTQCGAHIEIDNSHEAGICQYCGTAFITEKAIHKYTTFVTNHNNFAGATINVAGVNIENLLKLGRVALDSNNEKEALDYANRALEIDSQCTDAWILKMEAVSLSASVEESKTQEIRSYGNSAIQFAPENKKEETKYRVNEFYLNFAQKLMLFAVVAVGDTEKLKLAWNKAGVNLVAIATVQQADSQIRNKIELLANSAINLKNHIEIECIEQNGEFQEKVKRLAELYIAYCKADQARTKIYGLTPEDQNSEATSIRRKNLSLITKGLEEGSVSESEIDHSKSSGGCYIATCVYGSYDCPQVWTLRRFRDYNLDSTWYGRLFIDCYYATSPFLVKCFGERGWFKTTWRIMLDKLVAKLNESGVENTPYQDKY